MEFALTRKQLNKKRAEAEAASAPVETTPWAAGPGAAPGAAGPREVSNFDRTFFGGSSAPQRAPAGDGVPPLLPEGFGRPAVAPAPQAVAPAPQAVAPAPQAVAPAPQAVAPFPTPPIASAAGLDLPPGGLAPEQPPTTRLRVRHRLPPGPRAIVVLRRYVGVAVVVAAIVAATLLVPAKNHGSGASGAPAPGRSAVAAVVR